MAEAIDPGGSPAPDVDSGDFDVVYDSERMNNWVVCRRCAQQRPAGSPDNDRAVGAVKAEHRCGSPGSEWHEEHDFRMNQR
jgi:hypothetical protein